MSHRYQVNNEESRLEPNMTISEIITALAIYSRTAKIILEILYAEAGDEKFRILARKLDDKRIFAEKIVKHYANYKSVMDKLKNKQSN